MDFTVEKAYNLISQIRNKIPSGDRTSGTPRKLLGIIARILQSATFLNLELEDVEKLRLMGIKVGKRTNYSVEDAYNLISQINCKIEEIVHLKSDTQLLQDVLSKILETTVKFSLEKEEIDTLREVGIKTS